MLKQYLRNKHILVNESIFQFATSALYLTISLVFGYYFITKAMQPMSKILYLVIVLFSLMSVVLVAVAKFCAEKKVVLSLLALFACIELQYAAGNIAHISQAEFVICLICMLSLLYRFSSINLLK